MTKLSSYSQFILFSKYICNIIMHVIIMPMHTSTLSQYICPCALIYRNYIAYRHRLPVTCLVQESGCKGTRRPIPPTWVVCWCDHNTEKGTSKIVVTHSHESHGSCFGVLMKQRNMIAYLPQPTWEIGCWWAHNTWKRVNQRTAQVSVVSLQVPVRLNEVQHNYT